MVNDPKNEHASGNWDNREYEKSEAGIASRSERLNVPGNDVTSEKEYQKHTIDAGVDPQTVNQDGARQADVDHNLGTGQQGSTSVGGRSGGGTTGSGGVSTTDVGGGIIDR